MVNGQRHFLSHVTSVEPGRINWMLYTKFVWLLGTVFAETSGWRWFNALKSLKLQNFLDPPRV